MLGLSILILMGVLILSAIAATMALVYCSCLKNWDTRSSKKGKICLFLGFVAVLIGLLTAIFFSRSNVIEYSSFISACLIVSVIIFCSYIIFSIVVISHKSNEYIRKILKHSREIIESEKIESELGEFDNKSDDTVE